jgi:branched-chain amino acid transport system ATP-binding protein
MAETILAIRNLRKTFGALKATDNVSLDLCVGEIHALIGPNGSGKTTLIHQIAGTVKQDGGTIEFLGQDIGGLGVAERARLGLGRSFQISSLAPEFSALRNVMLAVQSQQGSSLRVLRPVTHDPSLTGPAWKMLERIGLTDRAHVTAAELSHGERRRLEIAITLALCPRAFLFDEPMAGLGPESSKSLIGILNDLRQEAPILLVEHDMDAVFALADRVSVLVYGRIIASGSVNDIRNNTEVRRAYFGEHI